jgi:hypothetical protein
MRAYLKNKLKAKVPGVAQMVEYLLSNVRPQVQAPVLQRKKTKNE